MYVCFILNLSNFEFGIPLNYDALQEQLVAFFLGNKTIHMIIGQFTWLVDTTTKDKTKNGRTKEYLGENEK